MSSRLNFMFRCLIDFGECVDDLIPHPKCNPCEASETCNKIDEDTYCCDPDCSTTTTAPPNHISEPRVSGPTGLLDYLLGDEEFPASNMFIPWIVLWTLLLYLIGLAIAVHFDRLNKIRPHIIIMADVRRIAVDTFYLLTVETGNDAFAGTSARIYCVIFGDRGRTKVSTSLQKCER